MITIEQIRAARGLLNWTQAELASHTGLSTTAINNLERQIVLPRTATMNTIQQTFQDAGIEFTEQNGVRMRGEPFEFIQFEGHLCVERHTKDVITHTPMGGFFYSCGRDESNFTRYGDEGNDQFQEFIRNRKIDERIIVPHGNTLFVSNPKHYRWLAETGIGNMHWMVYGDRVSWFLWGENPRCVIIRSRTLAESHMRQFLFLWDLAKVPAG